MVMLWEQPVVGVTVGTFLLEAPAVSPKKSVMIRVVDLIFVYMASLALSAYALNVYTVLC